MPTEAEPDLDDLKETARRAAEAGEDLHAQIRDLTKSVFSTGELDMPRIREVTRSVLEGVSDAVAVDTDGAADKVRQSVSAIESAILHAAESSTLALREAGSQASRFASTELKDTLEDLRAVEKMLLDTFNNSASASREVVSQALTDFVAHAQRSGNAFREELAESFGELQKQFPPAGMETLEKSSDALLSGARLLTQVASGVLVGIGESLRARGDTAPAEPDRDRNEDID